MAYSNSTLSEVKKTFQIVETAESADLFSHIEPAVPSPVLTAVLERNMQVALAVNTAKAKSELIIANLLIELREKFDRRISVFSGIDFNVDAEAGLTGTCDFLVSLSPARFALEAPVIILVEAKKDDLTVGLGQCAAEMIAAQRFNTENGNEIPCIYGATTSGTEWLFLKLESQDLHIDTQFYSIHECDKILGILASMIEQKV